MKEEIQIGDRVKILNGQSPEPTFRVKKIRRHKDYTLYCGKHGEYSTDLVELAEKHKLNIILIMDAYESE